MLVAEGRSGSHSDVLSALKAYDEHWVYQHKYDGKRCLLWVDANGPNRAFSRSGKELRLNPDQERWTNGGQSTWFDGELLRMDGGTFVVLFDVVKPLLFRQRLIILNEVTDREPDLYVKHDIWVGLTYDRSPVNASTPFPTDGFIARHIDGMYRCGTRSGDVVKHKFTQLTQCYVVSWEAGKHREYGALNLAMVRDGELEYVGKVGTGLTQEQFKSLTGSKDFPLVEIKHLGFSPGGKLREPVFIRTL